MLCLLFSKICIIPQAHFPYRYVVNGFLLVNLGPQKYRVSVKSASSKLTPVWSWGFLMCKISWNRLGGTGFWRFYENHGVFVGHCSTTHDDDDDDDDDGGGDGGEGDDDDGRGGGGEGDDSCMELFSHQSMITVLVAQKLVFHHIPLHSQYISCWKLFLG